MRSASRLRLLKSLGGGKEDKAVGGGSLGASSFVFFRRQTTPFKGFLSRSLRTTSNARDDDDDDDDDDDNNIFRVSLARAFPSFFSEHFFCGCFSLLVLRSVFCLEKHI